MLLILLAYLGGALTIVSTRILPVLPFVFARDVAADGSGVVTAQRLYQLVRQRGPVRDRTFEIEFLDPGVQAYSFTFG